jgi:hypothetical protein
MGEQLKSRKTYQNVVAKRTCDWCGKLFFNIYKGDIGTGAGGIITIEFSYGSKHDESLLNFCMCDECWDKLKPSVKNNG